MRKEEKDARLYNRNFLEACKKAMNGIWYAIKSQGNIRKQLMIAIALIIIGFLFQLNKWECIVLCFAIFFVIVAEMINTAIETTVDLVTKEYHEKAKLAKDVAAGAVVIASINAIVVAYFLFFDKILAIFLK